MPYPSSSTRVFGGNRRWRPAIPPQGRYPAGKLVDPQKSMYKAKSLSINITANLINQVSAALFPLITFPYVSRILKPEGLGRVSFAETVVSYFIMFATLGIPLYGVRESAKRRDDKTSLSTLAAELFVLNMIMTAVAFVAFGAFMAFSRKANSDPALFWICVLPMFLLPLGFNWLFGGLEEYVYLTVRTLCFRVLAVIAVFLFVHTQEDFRIYAFIAALNIGGASLVNAVFVRKHISMRRVDRAPLNVWRHVKPVLLIFSLSSAISIYTSLSKVMLGYMTNDGQTGLYSAADRVVRAVVMLVTSMGIVLLPRVSYYIEVEKLNQYKRLTNATLQFISFISYPAAAGLIVSGGPLMLLLSGSAFEPAVLLVQIMGLNVILTALTSFLGYQVLYSQGKEKLLLYSVVLGAVCNFGLNWFLIPRWRAVGAAVSTLIAQACVTGAQAILSRGYSNFTWPVWDMLKYGVTALLMSLVVLLLRPFLAGASVRLLVSFGAGVAFYVTVMWLLKDGMLSAIWSRLTIGATGAGKAVGTGI